MIDGNGKSHAVLSVRRISAGFGKKIKHVLFPNTIILVIK